MMAIVIGVIAFALTPSQQDSSASTTTQIQLRYHRESVSKQNRMPSYVQNDEILCWYDGEKIYFDFGSSDINDDDLCTLNITSNEITNEFMTSPEEMTQGIVIGLYDTFDIEIIIPGIGILHGAY